MALDLSLIPLYYYSSHGEHSCSAARIEIHFIQVLKKARSDQAFFLYLNSVIPPVIPEECACGFVYYIRTRTLF
jgi:hypothetical protein